MNIFEPKGYAEYKKSLEQSKLSRKLRVFSDCLGLLLIAVVAFYFLVGVMSFTN